VPGPGPLRRAYQVGLCLALSGLEQHGVECTGISIVWSAHAGLAACLLLSRAFRAACLPCRLRHAAAAVCCLEAVVVVVWAYYAVVAEALTTVAHLAAFAMVG